MSDQLPARADPYELPEALREEIFQQVIVPDVLLAGDPQPQGQPEVVLLGGQPGAGKSSTAAVFQREFASRGGLVWVTWDDFRPFHPAYEELLATRPEEMPDATRATARWWQERASQYLRARRYNVLLEGGFREPAGVMATAEQFAEAGYNVRVAAVAVPAVLSRLGIIERYAAQLERVGTGRWTTAASHDADFSGTPEVLRQAETSESVHQITVFTRDGRIYDQPLAQRGDGPSPSELFDEVRATPLSVVQRLALANRLGETTQRLVAANAAHDQLKDMATEVRTDLRSDATEAHADTAVAPGLLAEALAELSEASAALDAAEQTVGPAPIDPPTPGRQLEP